MRLIDADAFIEELEADAEHIESSIAMMMHYAIIKDIEHAPTIDAVEVVRCRDCKYRETCEQIVWFDIGKYKAIGSEIDYCSYGEREGK